MKVTLSFNPYCIGSYSGSAVGDVMVYDKTEFQSLLYWKLFWKEQCPAGHRYNISFNPYCIGSYSGRLYCLRCSELHCRVSILIVLEVILEANLRGLSLTGEVMFQSLLYWKLFWKSKPNRPVL